MSKTNYPGLDYSGPGSTVNRDANGIRYGIIPSNRVSPDALETIYQHGTDEDFESFRLAVHDHIKSGIKEALADSLNLPVEFIERIAEAACDAADDDMGDHYQGTGDCARYSYEGDGYKLAIDGQGDLWVFASPFVTNAQFCSPCAPGAGYLLNPCDDGPLTYCLGLDWFDEHNPCPYTPTAKP
jgi:hypothetical protein